MYRKGKPSVLEVRRFINRNRGIVYGMMLGDGTIDGRGKNARMRIRQCEAQEAYVKHKYELLKPVAAGPPFSSRWGNGKLVWCFSTSTSSEWQRVWSSFHQDSPAEVKTLSDGRKIRTIRKVITKHILRELDDHGLALWIMDDGCFDVYFNKKRRCHSKRLVLSTEGYADHEKELVLQWLRDAYGATGHLSRNTYKLKDGSKKTATRIRIGWTEYQKIIPRITPYIVPSMRYKIDPSQDKGRPGNRAKTHSDLAGDRESRSETAGRPA